MSATRACFSAERPRPSHRRTALRFFRGDGECYSSSQVPVHTAKATSRGGSLLVAAKTLQQLPH